MDDDDCQHLHIDSNGFCEECGIKLEVCDTTFKVDYSFSECHTRQSESVNYEDEISHLHSVPPIIKKNALLILNEKGSHSTRSSKHKQEIYIALITSHAELIARGIPIDGAFDEEIIIKELNLKSKHKNKCINSLIGVSENPLAFCEGLESNIVVVNPLDFIREECRINEMLEEFPQIERFVNIVLSSDSMMYILQENPKHIATAFIKIYFERIKKKQIPRSPSSKKGVSEAIIKKKIDIILGIIAENHLMPIINKECG